MMTNTSHDKYNHLFEEEETPDDEKLRLLLAKDFKNNRRALGHGRKLASENTGVPESTLRNFENTGKISLGQFIKLCLFYGATEQLKDILLQPKPKTIKETLRIIHASENKRHHLGTS